MSSPGVVFSMRFVQSKDAKDSYSRYAVGYMSRPQVFEKTLEHDNDMLYHDLNSKYDQYGYMSNKDKTDGLFDANEDIVSDYHKYLYTKIFDAAQKKDCPLYQGVISFDNKFLMDNGINFKSTEGIAKFKEIARPAVAAMIHESMLDDSNVVWTAAIHHNTDNIHIHVAVIEKEKVERRFDRLEEKAFEKLKSRVANAVLSNTRIEDLKTISQVFNVNIPIWIGSSVKVTGGQIDTLIKSLPSDIPWQYNRKGMEKYHAIIDKCVVKIITESPEMMKQFEKAVDAMNRCDRLYRSVYGQNAAANQWAENKMKDFYERSGNALLHEAENFRKTAGAGRPAGEKTEKCEREISDISSTLDYEESVPKVRKNDDISALKKYADKGSDYAQYKLGMDYLKGKCVQKDVKKGIEYLILSAEQGNAYAEIELAKLTEKGDIPYVSGISIPEYYYYNAYNDLEETIDPYKPLSNSKVYYKLGYMAENGKGCPYDIKKAVEYYSLSARCDNQYAMYKLAKIYLNGKEDANGGKIEKDVGKALMYFKIAAEKGNSNAAYEAGKIYSKTFHDVEKAATYFKQSADKNNPYAQYSLAGIYKKYDLMKEAINLYKASAEQGNAYAQYALGRMFFYGDGVEKSIARAIEYFNKSKEGGNKYAEEALKLCYKSKNNKSDYNYKSKRHSNNGENHNHMNQSTKQAKKRQSNIKTIRANNFQKNLCSLRAAAEVNKSLKRLYRDYEREEGRLENEFDYEQDLEIEKEKDMQRGAI